MRNLAKLSSFAEQKYRQENDDFARVSNKGYSTKDNRSNSPKKSFKEAKRGCGGFFNSDQSEVEHEKSFLFDRVNHKGFSGKEVDADKYGENEIGIFQEGNMERFQAVGDGHYYVKSGQKG